MSVITENISLLFSLAELYKVAMKNFMQDNSADFEKYTDLINMLKKQSIIGCPVTTPPASKGAIFVRDHAPHSRADRFFAQRNHPP